MWGYVLGVVLIAVGILISVYIHEAGHLLTAKLFRMKVTEFFFGFGNARLKLWSFRRGETEYGIKALPLGGYCKILGMTPDDVLDMPEAERDRAFINKPVWQRTIVLVTGSLTHFVIAFVLLWVSIGAFGIAQAGSSDDVAAIVNKLSPCVVVANDTDSVGNPRACKAGDAASPAAAAGLKAGDRITSVGGVPTPTYGAFQRLLRKSPADGKAATPLTYVRAGQTLTTTVKLVSAERVPPGAQPGSKATVSTPTIGIYAVPPPPKTIRYGALESGGKAVGITGQIFGGTFGALGSLPQQVPGLVKSLFGGQRDVNGPLSVVGVGQIGGEAVEKAGPQGFAFILQILASLNIFIGIFNLIPLLPMDGGHIVVAWFQGIRSRLAKLRGKPDPGHVDYAKLAPLTLVVVAVLGVFAFLTIAADIVNPIQLF